MSEEATLRASSGARTLAAGESVSFAFELLLTPCKPLDVPAHWAMRYYQVGYPTADLVQPDEVSAHELEAGSLLVLCWACAWYLRCHQGSRPLHERAGRCATSQADAWPLRSALLEAHCGGASPLCCKDPLRQMLSLLILSPEPELQRVSHLVVQQRRAALCCC